MAANSLSSSSKKFHILLSSTSVDLYSTTESFALEHTHCYKRPHFRTPSPGRILSGPEIKERLRFADGVQTLNQAMKKRHSQEASSKDETGGRRKVSDRFKEFIENYANKCRTYLKTSKKAEKAVLSNDIRVCEVFYTAAKNNRTMTNTTLE